MPSFHDVRFPLGIASRAQAVIGRRTEIIVLGSGHECRNARWADARRRWNVGYGCKSIDDLHAVIAFFEARRGRLHAFRFRDWADWKSCPPQAAPAPTDQEIGTGDGVTTSFALVKTYDSGSISQLRRITRPVAGTVRAAVDGAEQMSGFTVDHATGTVTFDAAPAAGAVITAGYEFDVPARFDTDELRVDLDGWRYGASPDIDVVEVRE